VNDKTQSTPKVNTKEGVGE